MSDTIPPPATSAPRAAGADAVRWPKPGWRTSELWVKLLSLALAPVYASGLITNDVAESIMLMIITVLGAFGYGINRSLVKSAAIRARLVVAPDVVTPPRP